VALFLSITEHCTVVLLLSFRLCLGYCHPSCMWEHACHAVVMITRFACSTLTLQVLTPLHVRALATVIPPLERMRDWSLSYSTRVHGISLATLYRWVCTASCRPLGCQHTTC
jgi:hypothetical protein